MNYRHHVSISSGSLPQHAFEEICAIAPEGRQRFGFRLQVDSDAVDGGEVIRRIIAICAAHGLRRRRTSDTTSYGYHVDRCYGDDRLRSEFLILTRQVIVRGPTKEPRIATATDLTYKLASALSFSRPIVVSDDVRRVLESENLIGLRFGEVAVEPQPESQWGRDQGPFWDLQSSIVMPKMANWRQFVHPGRTEAEPFRGDYSRVVLIDDPPFSKGEVHYRGGDLSAMRPFDIAKTFENFMEVSPSLAISQRFYQFCLNNGILLNADPVRIDPD